MFSAASAVTTWSFGDSSLASISVSGTTITFNTANPHGLVPDPNDTGAANGRVSFANVNSYPSLNGTFLVQTTPSPMSFTVQVANVIKAPTPSSDPFLSVLSGVVDTVSGVSDVGGADSLISLGLWGADGQTVPVQSGTFMHELGHSLTLTHGGLYPSAVGAYAFTLGPNCKPNYQSVMNYLFQVDLLDGNLDYSEGGMNQLDESTGGSKLNPTPIGNPIYPTTRWYGNAQQVFGTGPVFGSPATRHCDGTFKAATDPAMYRAATQRMNLRSTRGLR